MSQENVEIVRAVYERWSEGDFRAAVGLFDPQVVLVLGPEFLSAGTYLGAEAIAAYTRSGLLETDRRLTLDAEEIFPAGDSVLVGVRGHSIGRASGVPTELPFFMVWSFRGRKVIRLESFRERAEALEAVGLSEQAMSRENVDRMRSYYKLFNERRLDEWLLTFDPNVQWHTRRDEPDTTTYHGREGMLELAERWIESFPDFRVDPEEFHAIADCVIVVSRLRGSGSASRLAVDVVYVFAHRLLHGLVLETWACTTKDEALEAVGLSE